MKKLKLLNVLFLTVLTLAFNSCNKNDDNADSNGAEVGQLIAIIDGESYVASNENAVANFINDDFGITAINTTTNQGITVGVINASVGTFDIGPQSGNGNAYNINGEDAFLSHAEGGSGSINITKIDTENKLASGTFEFVGVKEYFDSEGNIVTETVTITGGVFNDILLITEAIGVGDSSLDADVDGVAMNPDAVTALKVTFQGNTTISISAINNSTNQLIGIAMPGDITVGTHNFDTLPFPGSIVAQYNPDFGGSGTAFASIDGTLTVSSYDSAAGTMTGSFEFTAGDFTGQDPTTYAITNGTFDVEIIE